MTKTKEQDLKPCRKCGDYVRKHHRKEHDGHWYQIKCVNCEECTPWYKGRTARAEVMTDWNTYGREKVTS